MSKKLFQWMLMATIVLGLSVNVTLLCTGLTTIISALAMPIVTLNVTSKCRNNVMS